MIQFFLLVMAAGLSASMPQLGLPALGGVVLWWLLGSGDDDGQG